MSGQSPENDPRSVSELIDIALAAEDDWEATATLHWRGTREVLEAALALAGSGIATHRALAADILGQLGIPDRTFPDECFGALIDLLEDQDVQVVWSAIYALGHLDADRSAERILPFRSHPDADVRHAVAFALGGVADYKATAALLELMIDADIDVRDWATFGIGILSKSDSAEIRTALAAALDDQNEDIRFEAICGLGLRRDRRAIPYLEAVLREQRDNLFAREAAAALIGASVDDETLMTTETLLGALQRSRR